MKTFFLHSRLVFLEASQLDQRTAEVLEKNISAERPPREPVQRINEILSRPKLPETKKLAKKLVEDSINTLPHGRLVGLSHFDIDRTQGLDANEFGAYAAYVSEVVTFISEKPEAIGFIERTYNSSQADLAIDILTNCPELYDLMRQGLPLETLQARAHLVKQLRDKKNRVLMDPYSGWEKEVAGQIDAFIILLLHESRLSYLEEGKISSKFGGWHDPFHVDYVNFGEDTIPMVDFIAKFVGGRELMAQASTAAPLSSPEVGQEKEQIDRFVSLIRSIEGNLSGAPGRELFLIYQALFRGDLAGAVDQWNQVLVHRVPLGRPIREILKDPNLFSQALRRIGDTDAAGKTMVEVGMRDIRSREREGDLSEKEEKALSDIEEWMRQLGPQAEIRAQGKYEAICAALEGTPEGLQFQRQEKNQILLYLTTAYTLQMGMESYVSQYGSRNLPPILQQYDDMKGLYGALNLTDENAKIAREVAIVIASTLISLGVSTLFNSLALGQMALRVTRLNRLRRIGKLAQVARLSIPQRLGIGLLNGTMKGTIYSGAETILNALYPEYSIQTKTALSDWGQNVLMYTAFQGIGGLSKLIAKCGLSQRLVERAIVSEMGIEGASNFLLGIVATQLIEEGKIPLDIHEFLVSGGTILIYRLGTSVFTRKFPRLSRRIRAQASSSKNGTGEKGLPAAGNAHGAELITPAVMKEAEKIRPHWQTYKGKMTSFRQGEIVEIEGKRIIAGEAISYRNTSGNTREIRILGSHVPEGGAQEFLYFEKGIGLQSVSGKTLAKNLVGSHNIPLAATAPQPREVIADMVLHPRVDDDTEGVLEGLAKASGSKAVKAAVILLTVALLFPEGHPRREEEMKVAHDIIRRIPEDKEGEKKQRKTWPQMNDQEKKAYLHEKKEEIGQFLAAFATWERYGLESGNWVLINAGIARIVGAGDLPCDKAPCEPEGSASRNFGREIQKLTGIADSDGKIGPNSIQKTFEGFYGEKVA